MIQNEHIEEFLRQAHRVGDAGLTVCSSGRKHQDIWNDKTVLRNGFRGESRDGKRGRYAATTMLSTP